LVLWSAHTIQPIDALTQEVVQSFPRALLAVPVVRRIRSPSRVRTSIHQIPPRLQSDIPSPFSESLATLAEGQDRVTARIAQDRRRGIPSTARPWRPGSGRAWRADAWIKSAALKPDGSCSPVECTHHPTSALGSTLGSCKPGSKKSVWTLPRTGRTQCVEPSRR